MSVVTQADGWRRVSKREPCPICGKPDFCSIAPDGAVVCMRIVNDHPTRNDGYWYPPPNGASNQTARLAPVSHEASVMPARADADTLDRVYSYLLAQCPLSDEHRALLTGPGHGLSNAGASRYGTLPADSPPRLRVRNAMIVQFGTALPLTVPGFIYTSRQNIDLAGAGIILPRRDAQERITGFQIRAENPQPGQAKYVYLSSSREDGPSPGSAPHVARPADSVRDHRVWITEGIKKADATADRLGAVTIGLMGITTWRQALPILEEIGADVAVIALDQDTKPETIAIVNRCRQELAAALASAGYAVWIAVWAPETAKGIDDLLLAGHAPTLERYKPIIADVQMAALYVELAARYSKLAADHLRLQKQQQALTGVILSSTLKPTDKDCIQVTMLVANRFPDVPARGNALVRVSLAAVAKHANVSVSTAGRSLKYAAEMGLIKRELRRPCDAEGRPILDIQHLYVGAGRLIGPDEPMPAADYRRKDAARKRCPECGSTHLHARTLVCAECGCICTVSAAAAAGMVVEADRDAPPIAESADKVPITSSTLLRINAAESATPLLVAPCHGPPNAAS